MANKKANSANSAKETAKRANAKKVNNRRAAEKVAEAISVVEAVEVEAVEVEAVEVEAVEVEAVEVEAVETQTNAAALPVAANTDNGKVSSKDVLKAVGSLRAAVREERRGANCTIRLIAERAAAGDSAAVDVLCALCDVPRSALFALDINKVRAAVNAWYPFVVVTDGGRKINVRAKSVHYTTASTDDETQEDAKKRVTKGYYTDEVTDYLTALTCAARARAKGQKQIVVDANMVYEDNKMTIVTGVSIEDIRQAIERKIFSFANVNVWRKNNIFGYYI